MPFGHAQDRAQQRTVDVALEGRLDLRAVAHLVRKVRRDVRQRLHLPRRPIHRSEDHHQRLGKRRRRVFGLRRQLAATAPRRHATRGTARTARPARRPARCRTPGPPRTPAARRDRTRRPPDAIPSPPHASVRLRLQSGQRRRARGRARAGRRPGSSPSTTHSAARSACGTSITAGASCASAALALRGSARKLIPNALTKHAAARAVVSASSAPPTGNRKWTSGSVEPRKPNKKRLKRQPLAREAVERRQAGNRHRADEKEQPGPRHPPQQAAELFDLPRAGGHHHAAGAEEEQSLEHRVIQHVVQARRRRRSTARSLRPYASAIIPAPRPSRMIPMFSML